jgi:hypothetical protein
MACIVETYEQYAERTGSKPVEKVATPDKEMGVALKPRVASDEVVNTTKEETVDDGSSKRTRKSTSE